MKTISETIELIKRAHAGQKYGDDEYWKHPYQVSLNLPLGFEDDEDTIKAALLHDTVEDTNLTIDDIRELYGWRIANIVSLLTKDESLSYEENIQMIIDSGNRRAMAVKLADNYVNFSGDKEHMKPERKKKLMDRYSKSMVVLTKALIEHSYCIECDQNPAMDLEHDICEGCAAYKEHQQ